MGTNRKPTIKLVLLFGLPFLSTVAGNAVYEHLVTPVFPFLPRVPFMLYSFFTTAFAVLFLLGFVFATWQLFANGWKLLTNEELQSDLRARIRSWPTSKWDLLPVIAATYVTATMLPLAAVRFVLPQGRLAGTISQEDFANIFLFVFTPMLLIFLVMLIRFAFDAYRDMKQRWVSGTPRERIALAALMAFGLVAWAFMVGGELAGWDDLLWMNST